LMFDLMCGFHIIWVLIFLLAVSSSIAYLLILWLEKPKNPL
jgi:hypothetical protein